MMTISEMLGVPEGDRQQIRHWLDLSLHREPGRMDISPEGVQAFTEVGLFFYELAAEKRERPADDMISRLCDVEVEGDVDPVGERPEFLLDPCRRDERGVGPVARPADGGRGATGLAGRRADGRDDLRLGVAADATGFMGDEVVDLPVLRRCGFACAPPASQRTWALKSAARALFGSSESAFANAACAASTPRGCGRGRSVTC